MAKMRTELTQKVYTIMDREMKELGPFIVKKQCLQINVDPDNIQPSDLPQLASKLAEVMQMFAGHEKANRIYSEIRKLKDLDALVKEEKSEGTKLKMLEDLGKGSLYAGEWNKAIGYFELLLKDAEQRKDVILKTKILKWIGLVYEEKADFDGALVRYEQALKTAQTLANRIELANCHNSLGDVHWHKGDLRKAMEAYRNAADNAESAGYKAGVGMANIGLGNVFADRNELDQSVDSYLKALDHLKYTEEFQQLARAYNNLGDTYMQKETWDKALECFGKSCEYAEKGGWLNMSAWAQFNSALVLSQIGKPDDAVQLLQGSQSVLENIGDKAGMAGLHHAYGRYYREKGDVAKMELSYKKAAEAYHDLKMPLNEAETRSEFGMAYIKFGKKDKALEQLRTVAVLYSDLKLDKRAKKIVKEIEGIR